MTDNFNRNKYSGLILFDTEKAFDTMWHDGLVFKLIKYNFPEYLTRLIFSYIKQTEFIVSIKDTYSRIKQILAGVPQGSVLGPILYILYINDIPNIKNTNTALFADDTAIFTTSWRLDNISNRLSTAAHKINKHCYKWKIKLNEHKTEATLLTKRRPRNIPRIKINNNELE